MAKKTLYLISLGVLVLSGFVLAINPVLAQLGGQPEFGPHSYGPNICFACPGGIMDRIVGIMWPIFVTIVIVMFVVAGILFLTAQGQPEKLTQAKQAFIWGVIGVVVGILAYSIVFIVQSALGGGGFGGMGGSGSGCVISGSSYGGTNGTVVGGECCFDLSGVRMCCSFSNGAYGGGCGVRNF